MMVQYGQDIKTMMQQAQKEQKKGLVVVYFAPTTLERDVLNAGVVVGTDAMLSALSLVNNKVQEFDTTNTKMLEQLEQKEQLRFVEWSQRWSKVMDAQLAFHGEAVKKLKELEQVRRQR